MNSPPVRGHQGNRFPRMRPATVVLGVLVAAGSVAGLLVRLAEREAGGANVHQDRREAAEVVLLGRSRGMSSALRERALLVDVQNDSRWPSEWLSALLSERLRQLGEVLAQSEDRPQRIADFAAEEFRCRIARRTGVPSRRAGDAPVRVERDLFEPSTEGIDLGAALACLFADFAPREPLRLAFEIVRLDERHELETLTSVATEILVQAFGSAAIGGRLQQNATWRCSWSVSALGGTPTRITDTGANPNLSRDGQRLVYESRGRLWTAAADG